MNTNLVTVNRTAEELTLKPSTIRVWIKQRRLGHVRLGRAIRIPATEIQRVIDEGYVPPQLDARSAS